MQYFEEKFMGQRAGVFCHNGLGDGVNTLVLSNNLQLNGWRVDTYHNMMGSMQNWFPHIKVIPYPPLSELPRILGSYDRFFVVHNDTDLFVKQLIDEGKRRFPDQIKVIYLYPSKHIVKEPFYSDCLIDPSLPIAKNLVHFCEKVLHLPKITKTNGFIPPEGLIYQKYHKRVAIHPTSARETRNWPKEKFLLLGKYIEERGFDPIFIPGKKMGWEDVETALFSSLDELAQFLYESGFLIGNDSGLGHLASALGVPTLTLCRRKTWANMWAPSFHNKRVIVTPSPWIPNIRGLRLRDRHWKKFITVGKAKRAFEKLLLS